MVPEFAVMVPEFTVFNFTKSLHFYCDILGFRVRYSRKNPDFVYLCYEENVQLMLEAYQEDGWNTGELVQPLGRGINIQIEVRSLEKLITTLEAQNYPLYQAPHCATYCGKGNELYKQRQFLVQDPDGYLLRFIEVIEA